MFPAARQRPESAAGRDRQTAGEARDVTRAVRYSHIVSLFSGILSITTIRQSVWYLKETVHQKIKILSSFTHPQVDPNLYECVCSEHKGRYFEESL